MCAKAHSFSALSTPRSKSLEFSRAHAERISCCAVAVFVVVFFVQVHIHQMFFVGSALLRAALRCVSVLYTPSAPIVKYINLPRPAAPMHHHPISVCLPCAAAARSRCVRIRLPGGYLVRANAERRERSKMHTILAYAKTIAIINVVECEMCMMMHSQ